MENNKIIHETIIRDIVDITQDIKDYDVFKKVTKKKGSMKSIANASSDLVLVFPVLVSRNVSIEVASMVAKAIERKAVSLLQILFNALCIDNVDNAVDYVKKFHNNLDTKDITVDTLIDITDSLTESKDVRVNKEQYEMVKRELKDLYHTLPNSISEHSLNEFSIDSQRLCCECRSDQIISNTVKATKDLMDITKHQLIDTDIKKSNELIPTMMIVTFDSVSQDSPIPINAIIGVKAKLYGINSDDMINRIKIKNQDKNGFLKLIKATTKEISFVRDFLFAIDRAKLDALSHSKRGSSSKLWKVLERRAIKSRVKRAICTTNDASAISTMVITQEEVEYLKKTENIDLIKPYVVRPIMESYNLMGVCIVDETLEVANFMFDTGDDLYESISFRHLERESSDNNYKKIINLMTKIQR